MHKILSSKIRLKESKSDHLSRTLCLVLEIKLKMIDEALTDDGWIIAMKEELHQFTKNDVWTLVP